MLVEDCSGLQTLQSDFLETPKVHAIETSFDGQNKVKITNSFSLAQKFGMNIAYLDSPQDNISFYVHASFIW